MVRSQLAFHAAHAVFSECPVGGPDAVAEKVEGPASADGDGVDLGFAVGAQGEGIPQEGLDRFAHGVKVGLVVVNDAEIVHVSQISGLAQLVLGELVEVVQVDVGEELARQIADGDASRERVARVGGAVDDLVEKPQGVGAGDAAAKLPFKDRVGDVGKIFGDIGLEHVDAAVLALDLAHEGLGAVGSGVRALARTAGVGVADEAPLPDRLNGSDQGVLHNAVF